MKITLRRLLAAIWLYTGPIARRTPWLFPPSRLSRSPLREASVLSLFRRHPFRLGGELGGERQSARAAHRSDRDALARVGGGERVDQIIRVGDRRAVDGDD
jgi:hypothetical protein